MVEKFTFLNSNLKTLGLRVVILGVDLSLGHMSYGQKLGSGGPIRGCIRD